MKRRDLSSLGDSFSMANESWVSLREAQLIADGAEETLKAAVHLADRHIQLSSSRKSSFLSRPRDFSLAGQ